MSCSARTLLFVRFAVLHWRSASFFHSPKVLFTENGIECSQGISPYEHSIFLFYVQRYTQKPDLAVYRDPHRGADRIADVADTAAVPKDRAEIVDIGGNKLIEAG